MKVWLTRSLESLYSIWFTKPIYEKEYMIFTDKYGFNTDGVIEPWQAKKLFNLKRHLRAGSKKILEFEMNVLPIKDKEAHILKDKNNGFIKDNENKQKIKNKLCNIIDSWFSDFICKKSGIGFPCYNPYHADINVHTFDENEDKEVLQYIGKKHNIDMFCFDGYTPLILLALYVYLEGEE